MFGPDSFETDGFHSVSQVEINLEIASLRETTTTVINNELLSHSLSRKGPTTAGIDCPCLPSHGMSQSGVGEGVCHETV